MLCHFLFLLHLITAEATNGKPISNKSHGKVYLYLKQANTREEAEKICKANNMNLLSIAQQAGTTWFEKILGTFLGIAVSKTSTFVCEKNDISRINDFTQDALFSSAVTKISSMMGNRLECAVHCSDILRCDIFTYSSKACQFYSKDDGSGSTIPCNRLQCYVKI